MTLLSEHAFAPGQSPVRHHRLKNGLQLLLLRDTAAPLVAYQTWFSVGSRNERDGITGIAHLFEHLMFNQTEKLPPGEFDKRIEAVGGDTNAATWVDWTYYRDNLPRTALPMIVELEAERMGHLVLGHDQVESEREVVANERRFRVEDDVEGFLSEELYKLAFTTHPYHWPTIGWMRDIKAITIDDCRTFYKTYYAPNNATVVVVGDFDEAELLAMIEQHYGVLAAAELPAEAKVVEPAQTGERRQSWPKPVSADKLRIGYRGVALGSATYPAWEVLTEILFGGNSSRLYRLLVSEGEIATSASGSLAPFRDAGLYEIGVSLKRGHHAAEAEAIVYAALQQISQESDAELAEELETARTRLRTRFFRELRQQSGKAEALGHYHTTLGDYRPLFGIGDSYVKVTAAEVRAVVAQLVPAQRTVVIAEPSGEPDDDDDDDDGDSQSGTQSASGEEA